MSLKYYKPLDYVTKFMKYSSNTKVKIRTKIKGTVIEKMVDYIKNVCTDYREVAISVGQDIKQKPIKAIFIFTGMGCAGLSLTHNPNEQSFRSKFIECSNQVSLVNQNIVNPEIVKHLNFIQKCYNQDLIRYSSFGLFSIIWVDRYSDQCNLYENNCSYLKVTYSEIPKQIIDFGFLNIWWVISRKMLDYDINY